CPAGNQSRSSARAAGIPDSASAGAVRLANPQASLSAAYAWSSGAIGRPGQFPGGVGRPAQIAATIAKGCPMRSYSRAAAANAAGARAGLTRHQQAAARIFIVAALARWPGSDVLDSRLP